MVSFVAWSLASFALHQGALKLPKTITAGAITSSATTQLYDSNSIHQDSEGKCVFGQKSYWDDMYTGDGDRPAESYSWYCGWDELAPFWKMLVPDHNGHVLIAGIGNDPVPLEIFQEGYTKMTAFDYSQAGVDRAKLLFDESNVSSNQIQWLTADARDLPLADASIDATFDKGTLDAIFITGKDMFLDSVKELGRVTAKNGVVVCVSRVIEAEDLMSAFDSDTWEITHNGELAFAPDGEATIDLGADLYSWRRTGS